MGLVRRADADDVAAGEVAEGGSVDTSTLIRQAVTAEIERQRLASLQADAARDAELPGHGL